MSKFRIGRHINISHGFTTAPKYAASIGCQFLQVFLGAPQQVISKAKSTKDLQLFGSELKKYKLKAVIHGSYTINFCQPATTTAFKTAVRSLVQDLTAASVIGKRCIGVIIHMGKNVPVNKISTKKAIANYIHGLKTTLAAAPDGTTIILETGASQGTEVASRIDGLNEIYWALTDDERNRIKFCIDTCHIWATGYDIATPNGVKEFFKEFDKTIGVNRIACIHFNDSKNPLKSCVDRHADIGYGFIGIIGLKAVAKFAKQHKIPIIMETPLDAVNPKTNLDVTFDEELNKVKTWLKN